MTSTASLPLPSLRATVSATRFTSAWGSSRTRGGSSGQTTADLKRSYSIHPSVTNLSHRYFQILNQEYWKIVYKNPFRVLLVYLEKLGDSLENAFIPGSGQDPKFHHHRRNYICPHPGSTCRELAAIRACHGARSILVSHLVFCSGIDHQPDASYLFPIQYSDIGFDRYLHTDLSRAASAHYSTAAALVKVSVHQLRLPSDNRAWARMRTGLNEELS